MRQSYSSDIAPGDWKNNDRTEVDAVCLGIVPLIVYRRTAWLSVRAQNGQYSTKEQSEPFRSSVLRNGGIILFNDPYDPVSFISELGTYGA